MKKLVVLFGIIIVALALILGGCPVDDDTEDSKDVPSTDLTGLTGGPETGRAWGMHSWIEVTLTIADGIITNAIVTGHDTPSIGEAVIEVAAEQMMRKNSVEIDVIAGVTITCTAIREAGREAVGKIRASMPD